MDSNFISVFRSIPLWPNDLVPLDQILNRLLKTLGIDPDDAATVDPLMLIGGLLGFREIKVRRYDGVTTVTGQIVIATELVLAPFQSYVGIVIGDPAGGTTSFPFSLRIKDEPPIKNNDEIFEFNENTLDPQLAAFQPVEKNPEAGFFDTESWRVSLRKIPAKIRILKGVTRVEPLDPNQPALGFRELPDEHVDVGIELSLDFDAEGKLDLFPPDPTFTGAEGDPASALDLDLGWFHINESPLYVVAQGVGYHQANTNFPEGFEAPEGLDPAWSGFMAQDVGGAWWKKPANASDEEHFYVVTFKDLLIGNDVFAIRGSFEHGGGPNDPFNSTVPVPDNQLPASRWSIRKIELWVADGAGDILQFGGQVTVAAILGFFRNQPIKFDLSLGRILKEIVIEPGEPPVMMTLPLVQLTGGLSMIQNHTQPTPSGQLRMPMFEAGDESFSFQLNGVHFELIFPGGSVPGVDIPTRLQLQVDLGLEFGDDPTQEGRQPKFEVEVPGVGFLYPSPDPLLLDFQIIWQGIWFETTVKGLALSLFDCDFAISRIGLGFGAGATNAYWLAFDAHILFPDALGRAEVYGMRLGWDDNGFLITIEGVGLEVKKPAFELAGIVRFLDGASSFVPEGAEPITIRDGSLAGFLRLAFPTAGSPFAFEVGFMRGTYMVNSTGAINSFWMLMAELVFPAGVPLGLGDLAFYGMAIALGNNVQPKKAATTSWFDWYSKELPKFSVIAPTKWTAAHDRWAFGLGVVFGSSVRSGYPHNERLLGIYNSAGGGQGSTWLFEGKVRFLKEVTKPGDPQIVILLVIAPDQVLFRAEFLFNFPAGDGGGTPGLVLTARGMIEVLCDRTGGGRDHIYFGRNQPLSERISGLALKGFFSCKSFYMLDFSDLQLSDVTLSPVAMAFGMAQGWKLDKKYGPLRLYFEVNVEFEVGFSFTSAFYGYLHIYGGLGLRIWGFGFGLSVDAAFTLHVSNGWKLTGNIKVKLNLPWPIPDYKKEIPLEFGPGVNPPDVIRSPLRQLALASFSYDGTAPLHEWSENNVLGVPADFNAERSQLAVDGSLLLAFRVPTSKHVSWITGVDAAPVDGSGEWKFRYTVEDIKLQRRRPGVNTFEPVPAEFKKGFLEINGTTPATPPTPTNGSSPLSTAITIWGDTPGQLLRNLGGLERSGSITWLEGYLDLYTTWPCGPDVIMTPTCVHFDLASFRLLDQDNTRITLLPDGTAIRSRSLFKPDIFPVEKGSFVVLDEVIPNPRPDLWSVHQNVLTLPFRYQRADNQQLGFMPVESSLEVDIPPSTSVEVTIFTAFPEELVTVQGLNDTQVVKEVSKTGFGFHDFNLNQSDLEKPINHVRIKTTTRATGPNTDIPFFAVSALASLCYVTLEQSQLQQHITEQRESLDRLIEILGPPPGPPGQNANHFLLHPQGTVYEVGVVVTCERKGPDTDWKKLLTNFPLTPARITVGPPPADLTPYLSETIPAREQDPVYLDDDLQLRFNHSYGPEMYTVSGFDFQVDVLDVQRQPVPIQQEWTFSEEPALTPAQEMLLEVMLSSACVTADISAVRKKLQLTLRPVMSPRTYYYLVIKSSAHPNRSLYEAPFRTSSYHTFTEQYEEIEVNHVDEMLPGPTNIAMLQSLLATLPRPTREEEHAVFEKIWEEALGFGFRERALRGEHVVFYEQGDEEPGDPRVLMIDSPEPLLVDRRTEFEVTSPSGTPIAVRNFDGSRTLVFVRDGNVVTDLSIGGYELTTTYRREVAGLPTQRINGNSSPSTASITFNVTADAQILLEVLE